MRKARWHQRYCQQPFPCAKWSALLAYWNFRLEVYIPHASQQLDQAAVSEGNAHDQVGCTQPSGAHVDQAQHEGGQGESRQAQGSRIGDATVLDLLVETRLKLTAEGRQALVATGGIDMGERTIAETSSGFGRLVLFVGHFTMGAGAVRLFVVVLRRVAGVVGIGHGGHCGGEESREGLGGLKVGVGSQGGRGNGSFAVGSRDDCGRVR